MNLEMDHEPHRIGFSNFTWTQEIVAEWEKVWAALWHFGAKWEWHNGDRYARRRGAVYQVFAVYDDAVKLDMAIPLPEINAIKKMVSWLEEAPVNNIPATDASFLIRSWIEKHVE